jgi:voltage-gated potassium channel
VTAEPGPGHPGAQRPGTGQPRSRGPDPQRRLGPPDLLGRPWQRFLEDPGSVGNAVRLLIAVTVSAIVVGSVVIWALDRREFPDIGTALWFALETITTVGYGDVTPSSAIGRLVAAVVMLTAIGFTTVITAAITSTFVEAAQRRRQATEEAEIAGEEQALGRIEAQLTELSRRLTSIEGTLAAAGAERAGSVSESAEGPGTASP